MTEVLQKANKKVKGWRTFLFNGLMLLVMLAEILLPSGHGVLALLCDAFGIGCGRSLTAIFTLIVTLGNLILRHLTDTPSGLKQMMDQARERKKAELR